MLVAELDDVWPSFAGDEDVWATPDDDDDDDATDPAHTATPLVLNVIDPRPLALRVQRTIMTVYGNAGALSALIEFVALLFATVHWNTTFSFPAPIKEIVVVLEVEEMDDIRC